MVCIQNLSGRQTPRFMRASILINVVVMVGKGVEYYMLIMEVGYSGVGVWLVGCGILELGGGFVVVVVEVEMEEIELVVECVMRMACTCLILNCGCLEKMIRAKKGDGGGG